MPASSRPWARRSRPRSRSPTKHLLAQTGDLRIEAEASADARTGPLPFRSPCRRWTAASVEVTGAFGKAGGHRRPCAPHQRQFGAHDARSHRRWPTWPATPRWQSVVKKRHHATRRRQRPSWRAGRRCRPPTPSMASSIADASAAGASAAGAAVAVAWCCRRPRPPWTARPARSRRRDRAAGDQPAGVVANARRRAGRRRTRRAPARAASTSPEYGDTAQTSAGGVMAGTL